MRYSKTISLIGLACAMSAYLHVVGSKGILATVISEILSIFLVLSVLIPLGSLTRSLRLLSGMFFASYVILVFMVNAYHWYSGELFDPLFLFDYFVSALKTMKMVLGFWGFLAISAGMLGFWLFVVWLWKHISSLLQQHVLPAIVSAAFLFILVVTTPHSSQKLFTIIWQYWRIQSERKLISPITQDYGNYRTRSEDPVFMLQLDSINGIAGKGSMESDGKKYTGSYLPNLQRIGRDGIYFPLFWANEISTNRAQEVILCGIVNNIGIPFSSHLDDLKTPCLPRILRTSGYTTIVFRADDLAFENEGALLSRTGFQEIHREDIMKEGDPLYPWGYDDCVFYQRSFEYLREHYPDPKKLLVYFEVNTHHFPFNYYHPAYTYLHPFKNPENITETYLNSLVEQDYCSGVFYKLYQEYVSDNAHLFVFGDHSYYVTNSDVGQEDMYRSVNPLHRLTSMAYVPPKNRRENFNIGSQVIGGYSHADLIPTVLELLSGIPTQNSLGFTLLKNGTKMHDDCQIIVQPYHWSHIAVLRNGRDLYKYNIENHSLSHAILGDDLMQTDAKLIAQSMDYETFRNTYFCERYR